MLFDKHDTATGPNIPFIFNLLPAFSIQRSDCRLQTHSNSLQRCYLSRRRSVTARPIHSFLPGGASAVATAFCPPDPRQTLRAEGLEHVGCGEARNNGGHDRRERRRQPLLVAQPVELRFLVLDGVRCYATCYFGALCFYWHQPFIHDRNDMRRVQP